MMCVCAGVVNLSCCAHKTVAPECSLVCFIYTLNSVLFIDLMSSTINIPNVL